DAEDLRPAAGRARGAAVRGCRAAWEAAAVPDRGRRARAADPPDVGRTVAVPAGGRVRAEDAGVPAAVRGRRRARADGGGAEEARGRGGADGGGRGGGGRAPRAGGARPWCRAARAEPGL